MVYWVMGHRGKCCYWQTWSWKEFFAAEHTPEFLSCCEEGQPEGSPGPALFCMGPKITLSEFKLHFSCLIQPSPWVSSMCDVLGS